MLAKTFDFFKGSCSCFELRFAAFSLWITCLRHASYSKVKPALILPLALQAKDAENEKLLAEKEKLLQAKDTEKMLLMQSLTPLYNRRAVETLIWHLVAVYPDCRVTTACRKKGLRKIDTLNNSATIGKLRHKLARCTDVKALRGAATIYKTLSNDLHNMPLQLSIETARWTGLSADEKSFMEYMYSKLMQHRLLGERATT